MLPYLPLVMPRLPHFGTMMIGSVRRIDIGRAAFSQGRGRPVERYFINECQAGIGGRVHAAKAMAQILVSAGAMIGSFIGAVVAGRIGRRPAYFGLCAASLLLCAWLFRFVHQYDTAFLILATLVGAATAAFYGWLPLYLPELFPTRVRATGQGLCYNSGRILAAGGALTQGQLVAAYGGSYAQAGATLTLVYLAGLLLIWLAPEAKEQPLPE